MSAPMQVAEGVYRFGTRMVNFYVVADDRRPTLVDAGMPRY